MTQRRLPLWGAKMKLSKDSPKYRLAWFHAFAWRGKVRHYGGSELAGHEAIVTAITKTAIQYVTHDILRVEVREVLIEDFFKLVAPDAKCLVKESALHLAQASRWENCVPPAKELIEKVIVAPETFQKYQEVVVKGKNASAFQEGCQLYTDSKRRFCLRLPIDTKAKSPTIRFIHLITGTFLEVKTLSEAEFNELFKSQPVGAYPLEKVGSYLYEYARILGATAEVMNALSTIIPIAKEDQDMAIKRGSEAKKTLQEKLEAAEVAKEKESKKDKKLHAGKNPPFEGGTVKKATLGKPSKEEPAKPTKKEAKTSKVAKADDHAPAKSTLSKKSSKTETPGSAADAFRSLIRVGKMSDDQIFASVQEAFGLDDSKRGYVKWYRNDMRKKGEKVPDAK